ncbi:zinc finger CCCH domain-containing protein [Musa troglodytarum]|uniref:Zinc finger CCCH domain-containing protein n=1 Tax=Musa troglodytarum TaxID=320322 RepID=A0A9E7HEJ3_9LILI|nr:zinc finger CCCH domain-containing protein [Musa troglodytarum]
MPNTRHNAVSDSSSDAPTDHIEGESMRHLKIEDGDRRKGADGQPNPYPCRPGQPDCSFYLRTGSCSYGSKCKYHHPTIAGQGNQYRGELPQRDGQPDCQFFIKTGTCKFGSTCKYHHPQDKHDAQVLQLNVLSLPLRKDEKSCPYYMRTGTCKFGVACKFNHPQPANVGAMFPESGLPINGYYGSFAPSTGPSLTGELPPWPFSRTTMSSPHMQGLQAFMPLIQPHSQATMPMQQDWSTYMGSIHIPSYSGPGPNHLSNLKNNGQPGSTTPVNFPHRPDQPECQYYKRTGCCRYGSSCKVSLHAHSMLHTEAANRAACKFDHPYVAVFPLMEQPQAYPYQRGSEGTRMTADNPSCWMPKAPDELMKPERIGELQDFDDIEHDDPSTPTSPSHTAPHSESSSVNQSDHSPMLNSKKQNEDLEGSPRVLQC